MKIFAFHLLNDYSGSPKVLSQLLKGWIEKDYDVNVVTCKGRDGFLSDITGVKYHYYKYNFAENKLVRLFNLALSQLIVFAKFFGQVSRDDIVYINTVLPFGAALVGKLKGCRVIYHVHETTVKPAIFKKFLFGIAKWAADDAIYVSNFLKEEEPFAHARCHVIYNAIEDVFYRKAMADRTFCATPEHVLMVCSLKAYKGVSEFLQLSRLNPKYGFRLIVNAAQSEVDSYFAAEKLPANLQILETQTNLHPHYQWADIILNLSRPDGWIETFGLTIIEGMAYGLPAIVPPVGGITELVVQGRNGYKVDSRNIEELNRKLNDILGNQDTYRDMVQRSLEKIAEFSEPVFLEKNIKLLAQA
ncbi:glycosyltransferase family 4 protein [Massilia sp. TSP1-1-2]|uniref:glycosyltransferase family 4 protein n=1 Tax=Massilia sp. TSP1-1-2 TaxID=2804649 RepID=UPI003CE785D4